MKWLLCSSVIVSLLAAFTMARKCYSILPKMDWGTPNMSLSDVRLMNLRRPGPKEGICTGGRSAWTIFGGDYNLPDKQVCVNFDQGKDIKPGEGPECCNIVAVESCDTLAQALRRNYECLKDHAPSDGWCGADKHKMIIKKESTGGTCDICVCVKKACAMIREATAGERTDKCQTQDC